MGMAALTGKLGMLCITRGVRELCRASPADDIAIDIGFPWRVDSKRGQPRLAVGTPSVRIHNGSTRTLLRLGPTNRQGTIRG